jgi:hypothetical protein
MLGAELLCPLPFARSSPQAVSLSRQLSFMEQRQGLCTCCPL